MTKKKHFHSLSGKGKFTATYAFFHQLPGSGSKYRHRTPSDLQKNEPPRAANTERLEGGTQSFADTVSTSNDTKTEEEKQA